MTAPTRRRPPATLHAARAAGHPALNWEAGEEKGNGAERGGGDITGSTQQQSRPTRHGRAPHDRRKGERCLDVTERSGQSGRDGNGAREWAGSASGRGKARVRGPLPDNAGSSNSRFGASVGSAHAPGVRRFGGRVRPTPSPRRPATTTRPTGLMRPTVASVVVVHPRPAAMHTYPSVVVAVGAVNHGGWAAARCPTTQLARWWVCGVGTPTTRAIPSPHFPIANGCAQKGRESSQGRTPVGGGGSRRAAGTGGGSILLPQPPQRQPPRLGLAQGEGTAQHRLGGGAPASCGCHHCFAR